MNKISNGIMFNLKKKQMNIKIDNETEAKVVLATLKKKLPEIKKLYAGLNPKIAILGKEFKNKEMKDIQKIFEKYFEAEVKFDCSKMLGLYGIRKPFKKEIATSETKFIRTSLRSGQKIEFEGSVVVLGDVNGGAEVIAGENVIVLGIIRGMVHAGAKGNKEAIISAQSIEATQIRISNIVKECEWEDGEEKFIKTNAYIDVNDEIIVE